MYARLIVLENPYIYIYIYIYIYRWKWEKFARKNPYAARAKLGDNPEKYEH